MSNPRPTLYALQLIARAESSRAARYQPKPHKVRPIKSRPMQSIPGPSADAFEAIQSLTFGNREPLP
jgi:hypothetical protein